MRKLFYTVVLSCTSLLMLSSAVTAGTVKKVGPTIVGQEQDVDVDILPPSTGPELVVPPTVDTEIGVLPGGSTGTIINPGSGGTLVKPGNGGTIGTIVKPGGSGDADTTIDSDKIYTGSEDLSCKSIKCADMGYSQKLSTSCEEYISCPFDISYKICTKYKGGYSLDSCPDNAICESKYQVTSCKDGYTMLTKSDGTVSCTILMCPTGEELGTLTDGSTKCVKTACALSSSVTGATMATLKDGKNVILSCNFGYVSLTSASGTTKGCIIDCKWRNSITGGITGGGTVTTKCPTGSYTSTQACNACSNGYKSSGTSGCYKCCTASENSKTGACAHCL